MFLEWGDRLPERVLPPRLELRLHRSAKISSAAGSYFGRKVFNELSKRWLIAIRLGVIAKEIKSACVSGVGRHSTVLLV